MSRISVYHQYRLSKRDKRRKARASVSRVSDASKGAIQNLRETLLSEETQLRLILGGSLMFLLGVSFVMSFGLFMLARRLLIPTLSITIPFDLIYRESRALSGKVDLRPFLPLIQRGLEYDVFVHLQGPLNPVNVDIGNFPIVMGISTAKGLVHVAEKPIHFSYAHPWTLAVWSLSPLMILYPKRILETVSVRLLSKTVLMPSKDKLEFAFVALDSWAPMEVVRSLAGGYLPDRRQTPTMPQIHASALEITAHLQGIPYYLHHHPYISFLLGYPVLALFHAAIAAYFFAKVYKKYKYSA